MAPYVMLMPMDQQPNQPVSYVDPYAGYGATPQQPQQPVTAKAKIAVVVMIIGIIGLIIGGVFFINGRKDPNSASMETIITKQAEISRISEKVFSSEVATSDAKDLAATVIAVSNSNQTTATKIYSEKFKGKISKELLASGINQANDDKLKQGELLDDVKGAYIDLLKVQLSEVNAAIVKVESKDDVEAQLAEMAKSNEAIFNSIAEPES